MALTSEQARARLERMLQWEEEPALTAEEVTDLLGMATVSDESYWNLRHAAAEGWRWKAGKVAGRFDFGSDVHSFNRSQVYKHCLEMAASYAKGAYSTMQIVGAEDSYDPVIGNLNGGA